MYDWNASEYHRVSDPQFGWGLTVLARLKERNLAGVRRACDAGCGTGRVTAEFIKALPAKCSVVALDVSERMLDIAAEALAEWRGRVEFVACDFQALPFENEFDLIFSTAAFHWAPDHDKLFAALYRAMKPGGALVAQCGGGANLARIRERETALIRDPRYARYFSRWKPVWNYATDEVTLARMNRARFQNAMIWLENSPIQMPDEASYRAFLATVIERTQLEFLPEEASRNAYLDEMIRLAAGDLTFDYVRLNIEAEK